MFVFIQRGWNVWRLRLIAKAQVTEDPGVSFYSTTNKVITSAAAGS